MYRRLDFLKMNFMEINKKNWGGQGVHFKRACWAVAQLLAPAHAYFAAMKMMAQLAFIKTVYRLFTVYIKIKKKQSLSVNVSTSRNDNLCFLLSISMFLRINQYIGIFTMYNN